MLHTAGYRAARLSRGEAFATATSVALARAVFPHVIPLASKRESQDDGLHRLCNRHAARNLDSTELSSMMTCKEVLNHVTAEPFRPFRIHTASGRSFEVKYPEVVMVGRTTLTLSVPLSDDIPDAQGMWNKLSLKLIESIEPLDAPVHPRE